MKRISLRLDKYSSIKLNELLNNSDSNLTDLIKKLIDKEHDLIINKNDPYKNHLELLEQLNNDLKLNINKLNESGNTFIETTNHYSNDVIKTINRNLDSLNENNILLKQLVNICFYSFSRLLKFVTLILHNITGFLDSNKAVISSSKVAAESDYNKIIDQLFDSAESDTYEVISKIREGK